MEIKTLEHTPLSEIVACFNHAFSDYFVPIAATETYMEKRWYGNRVDYSLSFGAFENGKLVAFIVHGIGMLYGRKTAYNAGTGVIPEFRGQKLVAKLYAVALPKLQAAGVNQSILEVISQNLKALKAYQNVGFNITRTLPCFRGSFTLPETLENSAKNYQVTRLQEFDLDKLKPLQTFAFSWENMDEAVSILKQDLECLEVTKNGELKGYLIYNPTTGAILQFGFTEAEMAEVSQLLFKALTETNPNVRVNNVDSRAEKLINLLQAAGLENHLDQYEMLLTL